MFFVQNNYSNGGDYSINISSASSGIEDNQLLDTKFGTRAKRLDTLYTNISKKIFAFEMHNDIEEMVYNVSWNCTDGVTSLYSANLTGNQSLSDYIAHNYTLPGDTEFTCTVLSNDGSESKTTSFTIPGLEIENYDILVTNISKRVVSYDVRNYFNPIETNISIFSEGIYSSGLTNISANENIMVFAGLSYSSDGTKTLEIDVNSADYSNAYTETFKTEGVSIEDYNRISVDYARNIIMFDVRNNWHDGIVNWSLNKPAISNSTMLNNNETLLVVIEQDSTTQGNNRAEVTAKASSFTANIKNAFEIRPLEIVSVTTLTEGIKAVSELIVSNNINNTQQFNWLFESGQKNISSADVINVSDDVLIYIASNYTDSGVYRTNVLINSTSYNDTQNGVMIV